MKDSDCPFTWNFPTADSSYFFSKIHVTKVNRLQKGGTVISPNHEIVLKSKSMNLNDRFAFIYAVGGPISFENV